MLTAVGLLPIAVAGLNIDRMIEGAASAYEKYNNPNLFLRHQRSFTGRESV